MKLMMKVLVAVACTAMFSACAVSVNGRPIQTKMVKSYSAAGASSQSASPIINGELEGKKVKPAKQVGRNYPVGWISGFFENPNNLDGWVILFEGSARVSVIPDPETGGWKYSRPAWGAFRVVRGYGRYGYAEEMLPRKTRFRYAFQAETGEDLFTGGPGLTWPKFGSFRTGSDPGSRNYDRYTNSVTVPSQTGWKTRLPYLDRTTGPVDILVVLDASRIGGYLADGLTNAVFQSRKYGRR